MDKMPLPPDFREFLLLLDEEQVEYMLIGGWAVGLYGVIRATKDMDIWIALDSDNARRAVRVLERFGFRNGEATEELLMEPGNIIRLGFPPLRIEMMNQIDGVVFDECYSRKVLMEIDDIFVTVISLDDLLKNKRASNRLKDQADVESLTE